MDLEEVLPRSYRYYVARARPLARSTCRHTPCIEIIGGYNEM